MLSAEEIFDKMSRLDKFERDSKYGHFIYLDGTGFRYNTFFNTWLKLIESYVYTYPLPDDFYEKIGKEIGYYELHKTSSIDEVLEEVSDDIRDTILFNLNLFR